MLLASIVTFTFEGVFAASSSKLPPKRSNAPRTLLITMWRTLNCRFECDASMFHLLMIGLLWDGRELSRSPDQHGLRRAPAVDGCRAPQRCVYATLVTSGRRQRRR